MTHRLRTLVLPPHQRRTLEQLTDDLDLRSGDRSAKLSAFWTMLVLAAVIATAGLLADSTATVIGAMIVAPLSTPIMGIALGIVTRERLRAGRFVLLGALLVVGVGALATVLLPGSVDLEANGQIMARTSPTLLDLVAAVATGCAGAVALCRKDVAAVLPGVAIAISLVPPLAVVGICLGEGSPGLALGALLLFVSNLVALVLAGTFLFAALGYAGGPDDGRVVGARRRSSTTLAVLLVVVLVPLGLNTAVVLLLHAWTADVRAAAEDWVRPTPGAVVEGVDVTGSEFRVHVRAPGALPPTADLLTDVERVLPDGLRVVVVRTTGEDVTVGTTGG